jgi:hypothetical protein
MVGKVMRFLAEKGEDVHHVAVATPSFDDVVAAHAEGGRNWFLGARRSRTASSVTSALTRTAMSSKGR